MQIHQISDSRSFTGKLYVVNKLSKKPAQCILKEKSNLLELIKKEKFDLFIKQDYSKNKINIIATTKTEPQISVTSEVPLTSKHSSYLDATKQLIKSYKAAKEEYIYNSYEKSRTFKKKFFDAIEKFLAEYGEP